MGNCCSACCCCQVEVLNQTFAGDFYYNVGKINVDKILKPVESEFKSERIYVDNEDAEVWVNAQDDRFPEMPETP